MVLGRGRLLPDSMLLLPPLLTSSLSLPEGALVKPRPSLSHTLGWRNWYRSCLCPLGTDLHSPLRRLN